MNVKIELTVDETTKEEFNLVVNNDQDITDLLWEVRMALRQKLHGEDK